MWGVAVLDKCIILHDVILLDALCDRWSCTKDDIISFCYKKRLVPYILYQTKINEDKTITAYFVYAEVYFRRFTNPHKTVFDMMQVSAIEKEIPALGWKISFGHNLKNNNSHVFELQSRIAELKAENAKLRADNEELKNSTKAGGESEEWLDLYPICKTIRGLHLAGKSRDEIRLALLDKGYSNAQTAFLTQEDTNIRTDNAQKQVMKRVKRKMGGT